MLHAVKTVTKPTVTDRLHTKYANHSFAEPEAGRKSVIALAEHGR
jgi:hypothetical protein